MTVTSPPARPTRPTKYPHTISFRLDDAMLTECDALRSTFDYPSFTEALRWLLEQPETKTLIAARVRGER